MITGSIHGDVQKILGLPRISRIVSEITPLENMLIQECAIMCDP